MSDTGYAAAKVELRQHGINITAYRVENGECAVIGDLGAFVNEMNRAWRRVEYVVVDRKDDPREEYERLEAVVAAFPRDHTCYDGIYLAWGEANELVEEIENPPAMHSDAWYERVLYLFSSGLDESYRVDLTLLGMKPWH